MPIKPFSFPLPETRFFHTTKYVYKFKIRYGAHFCSEDTENKYVMSELLDSIRAILASHDNLQPFTTKHFIVFPYKSKWDSASRLKFKYSQSFLQPFPYVFTVYVEPYALVYDSSESSSEKNSQRKDEDTGNKENCMCTDNDECDVSSHSDHLCRIPCPTQDHETQKAGGFVAFLMSDPCRQTLSQEWYSPFPFPEIIYFDETEEFFCCDLIFPSGSGKCDISVLHED